MPNPSFEIYSTCPNNISQINYATGWGSPTMGTPDYYNSCQTSPLNMGVPNNGTGYQYAYTGNAYVGIYTYVKLTSGGPFEGREYIQTTLTDSLQPGNRYCVSFYLNYSSVANIAIDNIGLFLSNNPVSAGTGIELPYAPQIVSPNNVFLKDTLNWYKVEGYFIANGGEKYITIGNFNDEKNTDTVHTDAFSASSSYYYIDDVSVILSVEANAGTDTTVCKGTGLAIGEASVTGISYNWQPATGLSNSTIAQPVAAPTVTTTYILTITDTTGNYCISKAIDTITINVNSATVTLGNDVSICIGQTKTLDAGNAGAVYLWSTSATTQTITANEPGVYWVEVNKNGCTIEDSILISIGSCDTSYIQFPLPNTFSPNGDGINDVFKIQSSRIKEIDFTTYNRWGIKVFEQQLTDNQQPITIQWDGKTTSGLECTDGVYYYILTAKGIDDKEYEEKGFITLIK